VNVWLLPTTRVLEPVCAAPMVFSS
jgi:hypothetical protein